MTRVKYVNRNHSHRLYGQTGVVLTRGRGPGPRNVFMCLAGMTIFQLRLFRHYLEQALEGGGD